MQRNGPTSLLLIAFFSFIVIGIPGGALGVAWLHIQTTFGLGLEALGVLLTTSTVGRLITAFTSGRLLARLGTGRFFLVGSLFSVAGVLGFVFAPVWPVLLAAYFVLGMGSGIIDAGINTFIAPRYSASRLNWLHACFGIGLTIGPVLVTVLVIDLAQSWRLAYGILAMLYIALTLIFAVTVKRWDTVAAPNQPVGVRTDAPIGETLRLVMVWLLLIMFFFYGGTEIGAGQLLNSLFVEGRDIDPKTSGFWVSFYWGSFTVGRMLIGIFVDRLGPRALVRAAMIGAVLGALLIWWNVIPEVSFVGLAIMGLSLAPIFPTLLAITADRVGLEHTPNAIGFQLGFAGVGAAILIGFAGTLAESAGREIIAPFLVTVAAITWILHEVILARETTKSA